MGVAVAALAGCAPIARRLGDHAEILPLPPGDLHPAARLLGRATFGPRPGDVARLEAMGHEAAVNRWLAAEEPEEPRLNLQLARLDVLRADSMELLDLPKGRVLEQLQTAGILYATYGRNPLKERMVEFWSDHFNIYSLKEDAAFRRGADLLQVVRAHALGRFPDLLRASAHSPAMLAYLDNQKNRQGHANENYARELMELHSLGVGGGYSQRDVQEVARCFTGWTLENRFLRPKGKFRFDPDQHDDGMKTVLGHSIPAGGGESDGDRVLEILAAHPSTAHFIAKKLVVRFMGTEDPHWIERTAQTYHSTGGDVRAMLRPLLLSHELIDSPPLLKRPFELVVSSLRALDADTDAGGDLQRHLAAMGQALYEWPMPDGYPTHARAWTGSMLPRWRFAHDLAHGKINGTGVSAPAGDPFEAVFQRRAGEYDQPLVRELRVARGDHALALCLASPQFQYT